jgi:hypothetical protein
MRNASWERRQTEDAILGVVLGCKVIKIEEYNARKMTKVKLDKFFKYTHLAKKHLILQKYDVKSIIFVYEFRIFTFS